MKTLHNTPLNSLQHLNVLAATIKRSIKALDATMKTCTDADAYQDYQGERDILIQTYHAICNRRKEIEASEVEDWSTLNHFLNTTTLGHA